jgi:hypothetical protein
MVLGVPSPNIESSTLKPILNRTLTYPLHSNQSMNLISVSLRPRKLGALEQFRALPDSRYFVLQDRPWFLNYVIKHNNTVIYEQSSALTDNSRCLDAPYAHSVRANNVSSAAMANQPDEAIGSQGAAAASCATWQPPSSGSGMGGAPITSFAAFLLILFFSRQRKKSA